MNEAVSGLGNSNGQAGDMLCMERAEMPAFRPTKWVSASQKIKKTLLRKTAFLLKVLIGIFDSSSIMVFPPMILLKPLSFFGFSPLKLSIFLLGKFKE